VSGPPDVPALGAPPRIAPALLRVALALIVVYGAIGAGLSWWQVVEAERLTNDPGDPLLLAAEREGRRGRIVDARGVVLAESVATGDGSWTRRYPHPEAEPILGYFSPDFGSAGLERSFAAELLGARSLAPGGDLLRKLRSDAYDPQDVQLSLDVRLQRTAVTLLKGKRGAIVAIEPASGRILALASTPTFDPNRIVDPDAGAAYFADLLDRPAEASALLDRATMGRYTPGSVLKVATAVAGLGSGAITPQTVYADQPAEERTGFLVEGFRVRDGHHPQTGRRVLDLAGAIEVSCNIWFARAGLDIGGQRFLAWGQRMGFGEAIPFDVPTAVSTLDGGDGFVDEVELANAAYGQSETFVTPLQMALVASLVAERGTLMRPHVVDELRSSDGRVRTIVPEVWRRVLDAGQAETIALAMQQAVEGRLGRRFAGAAKVPGVPTAGKSGTAELGGDREPHAWFIGFAPVEAPRIAVAVIVENGGAGGASAVPMGGELMATWLELAP